MLCLSRVAAAQEFSPLLNAPGPPFTEIASRADSTRTSLRHFIVGTDWDEKNPASYDAQSGID
jgi:hypothetical protein